MSERTCSTCKHDVEWGNLGCSHPILNNLPKCIVFAERRKPEEGDNCDWYESQEYGDGDSWSVKDGECQYWEPKDGEIAD